jgi:hypothetical protein
MVRNKAIPTTLAGAATVVVLVFAALASPAQALHLDGTVLNANAGAKTFRLTTKSGRVSVRVNARTKFQRISGGIRGLRRGLRIGVDATFSGKGLLARRVAGRAGGGGGGGGGGGDEEDEDDEDDEDEGGGDEAGGGDGEGEELPEDADPEERPALRLVDPRYGAITWVIPLRLPHSSI